MIICSDFESKFDNPLADRFEKEKVLGNKLETSAGKEQTLSSCQLQYRANFSAIKSSRNSFESVWSLETNDNSSKAIEPLSFRSLRLNAEESKEIFSMGRKLDNFSFGVQKNRDLTRVEKRCVERCLMRNKKRVLIVDDVPVNRKMLRRVLESRFDIVEEAGDGQEAVDLVRSAQRKGGEALYDVVTMDYQMPVMDGATACRIIRQLGYDGAIVAVTGNAYPADIQSLITNGANRVFLKPLNIKEFDAFLSTI